MRKIRLESKSTTKGDILKCFGVIILGINLSLVHVEACAKKNKFVRFYRPPNFGQETSIYIVWFNTPWIVIRFYDQPYEGP